MKFYNITIFGVKSTTGLVINYLHSLGIKINLLVSLKRTTAKKYHISGYENLESLTKKLNIKTYLLNDYSLKDKTDLRFFKNNSFGIGISYGWQRLIPQEILDRFSTGIFGFHGSSKYLPQGKGRSPFNWSIIEGKKIIHNHCFKYESGPDQGPIFKIMDFEINHFDTIFTIQYKSILTAQTQIRELLEAYKKNKIKLTPQSGSSSFYPKRNPEDGKIDFKSKTKEIYNLIRGVTKPFPGAFCLNKKDQITIWEGYPFDKLLDFSKYKVGEVIESINNMPVIKTKDGSIIINKYESKKKIKKGDILN